MVDTSPQDSTKSIYICDRGYASYNSFAHVIEKEQFFLIRCTDKKTAQILGRPIDNITTLDVHVERILSRSQSKKNRQHPEREDDYCYIASNVTFDFLSDEQKEYTIPLRVIRFELSDGSFENLITNLPDHEFHTDDFKELHFLRWNEETSFRFLKHTLCLKALHSKKYEYVIHEVWARAIFYNFCAEITKHVEIKQDPERKHVYKANYTEACKTCRAFLRLRDGTALEVDALIAGNIEPVRTGRKYPRSHSYRKPMTFLYR